jgi:tRNA (cmo5U34)-methyltransferase
MIKSGFDWVAPFYDSLATLVFGSAIRQSQTVFLHNIPTQASILVIGGGTGWILPELLTQTSPDRVLYLEASQKMLNLARQEVQDLDKVASIEFRLGTEKDIRPEEKFDVVISHFFLDLFTPVQLKEIIQILTDRLRPGGFWLVADFVSATGSGIRPVWTQFLIKSMYAFFRVFSGISAHTLPNWQNILSSYTLVPQKSAYFYHRMIKSVLYQKI